jgi:hypothetical protein
MVASFLPETLAAINSPESEIAPIQIMVETIALKGKISNKESNDEKDKNRKILSIV